MTGTEACDGFKNSIPEDEMMCVVIDCGEQRESDFIQ